MTEALPFSYGNPRIKEIRGVVHLYREDASSSSNDLFVGRKPVVCVLGVPNHMTYAEICQFCGSFIRYISHMQIVRNDGMEDQYSLWIFFDSQDWTDYFYEHFNGRGSSSLEVKACWVDFMVGVQYKGSTELAQTPPASLMEQSSCSLCLGRLDDDTTGILTTICNHSFHFSCISKWKDSSCPVCRYCPQQPGKSICDICQTSENLMICCTCGFVGCGWSKEGHAIRHAKETQPCYSYVVETQQICSGTLAPICCHFSNCSHRHHFVPVPRYCPQQPEKSICSICQTSEDLLICLTCRFVGCGKYKEGHAVRHSQETQHCYFLKGEHHVDYIVDNYVHQQIQHKDYGELVDIHFCARADYDCSFGINEAVLDSEFEAIDNEYLDLLVTQERKEESHFESLVREETERETSKATGKAKKRQAKLDKCMEDNSFLEDINESLLKDQKIWKANIEEVQTREKEALKLKDDKIQALEKQVQDLRALNSNLLREKKEAWKLENNKIQDLKEQLRDLKAHLEVTRTVEQSTPNAIKDGTVLRIQAESSSAGGNKRSTRAQKLNKRRK